MRHMLALNRRQTIGDDRAVCVLIVGASKHAGELRRAPENGQRMPPFSGKLKPLLRTETIKGHRLIAST